VSIGNQVHIVGNSAGVTLLVSGTFAAGSEDQINRSGGGAANQLTILIGANDGGGGTPPAASIGQQTQMTALLAAPHGTLAVAPQAQLTGAFAAFDISLSDQVQVNYQAGLPASTSVTGRQILLGQIPPLATTAPVVGSLPGTTQLSLAIGLPLQVNGVQGSGYPPLDTLIEEISAPNSTVPALTTAQFAAAYGPSTSDYNGVQDFATANSLTITQTFVSRNLLVVTGPAATVEQAFAVNLNVYERPDGTQFFAPANDPSVILTVPLLYVSGLTNVSRAMHSGGTSTEICPQSPIGSQNGYAGPDIRAAYLSTCTPAALAGQGQTIALYEDGGFYTADVLEFANGQSPVGNMTGLGSVGLPTTLTYVQQRKFLAGSAPSPWVPFGGTTYDPSLNPSDELEQVLDIDMVLSMAPQANILLYQNAPNGPTFITSETQVAPAVVLKSIAEESDASVGKAQIISSSVYWEPTEADMNLAPVFMELAAGRQSYFQASGDTGALLANSPYDASVPGPSTPGNVPGVASEPIINTSLLTVVGGTELVTGGTNGSLGSYVYETTWNDVGPNGTNRGYSGAPSTPDHSVSCGGFVLGNNALPMVPYPTLPIPPYQVGVQDANFETQNNPLQARMIPDVAWLADGIPIFYGNVTQHACLGGTSAAAPLWAGFAALVNQLRNTMYPTLGFANPALYAAAAVTPTPFNDIQDLSNNDWFDDGTGFDDGSQPTETVLLTGIQGGAPVGAPEFPAGLYHALQGYDMATGLGTPTCLLLQTLANCTGAVCNGTCVDLDTDPNNCGACGALCNGNNENCVGGQCQLTNPTVELGMVPTAGGPAFCILAYGFPTLDNIEAVFSGAPGGALVNTYTTVVGSNDLSPDAWYIEGTGVIATMSCGGSAPTCTFSNGGGTSVDLVITDTTLNVTLPPISIPDCYWCNPQEAAVNHPDFPGGSRC
jgi:hypothetical protein